MAEAHGRLQAVELLQAHRSNVTAAVTPWGGKGAPEVENALLKQANNYGR